MTTPEFKAWLDGFSQGIGDAPTAEQWAMVKAKVNELCNPLGNLTFPHLARGPGDLPQVYTPNQSSVGNPNFGKVRAT